MGRNYQNSNDSYYFWIAELWMIVIFYIFKFPMKAIQLLVYPEKYNAFKKKKKKMQPLVSTKF